MTCVVNWPCAVETRFSTVAVAGVTTSRSKRMRMRRSSPAAQVLTLGRSTYRGKSPAATVVAPRSAAATASFTTIAASKNVAEMRDGQARAGQKTRNSTCAAFRDKARAGQRHQADHR